MYRNRKVQIICFVGFSNQFQKYASPVWPLFYPDSLFPADIFFIFYFIFSFLLFWTWIIFSSLSGIFHFLLFFSNVIYIYINVRIQKCLRIVPTLRQFWGGRAKLYPALDMVVLVWHFTPETLSNRTMCCLQIILDINILYKSKSYLYKQNVIIKGGRI